MRKIMLFLLGACLLFSLCASSFFVTASGEKEILSLMSEEECIAFVKENGISLPAIYANESEWGPFVKQIIIMAEKNPNVIIAMSHTAKIETAEAIRDLVNVYYGVSSETIVMAQSISTDDLDTLKNSEVYSAWNEELMGYNCYGFAIETYQRIDPGFYHYWSNPPQNATGYVLNVANTSIEDIRNKVIDDLEVKQKERIFYQPNEMDTSNLCINESIICVRKGLEDYHFMRYTSDGWLHKPGQTQILRYLGTPTNGDLWTNEHVAYNVTNWIFKNYPDEELKYYDSTIYFISYNGHNWSLINNYNSTHTRICSICDDAFQYSCNLSYLYIGDSKHNAYCTECDYGISGLDCSYSYEANVNGTHKKTCALSDHYQATEACTYQFTSNGNGRHTATCRLCGGSYEASCEMTYEYWMYNQHKGECNLCGYETGGNCTPVATYCGNGSTHHIHANACRDCGNAMSSATESCTLEYVFAGTVNGVNTHSRVCAECDYVHTASASCVYRLGDYCFFCGTHRDTQQVASLDDPNTKE